MERQDFILAVLSTAKGATFTPVQVQKLLFLLDKKLGRTVGGPYFDFQPYHYGPFDQHVYDELYKLARQGAVEVITGKWNSFRLTEEGQIQGEKALVTLDPKAIAYIKKVTEFVRRLSFTQLVASIYKAYPEMRERSVFQG